MVDMAPGSTMYVSGPPKVSLILAAIVFFCFFYLFSCAWDQGYLMGLRRQYNLAPCGWEQGAEWDQVRVGSDHVRELVIVCLPPFSYGEVLQKFLRSTKRRTLLPA